MHYLLDTNIISEPFKLQPDSRVLAKLQENAGAMAIASVTWHELKYGLNRMPESRRKQQLEIYLSQTVRPNLPILPYDAVFSRDFPP